MFDDLTLKYRYAKTLYSLKNNKLQSLTFAVHMTKICCALLLSSVVDILKFSLQGIVVCSKTTGMTGYTLIEFVRAKSAAQYENETNKTNIQAS